MYLIDYFFLFLDAQKKSKGGNEKELQEAIQKVHLIIHRNIFLYGEITLYSICNCFLLISMNQCWLG